MTCLMHVCAQGECPPVALLLDHGANLEATDAEGATALWHADSKAALLLMMRRGAINIRDCSGAVLQSMSATADSSRPAGGGRCDRSAAGAAGAAPALRRG
eukprot:TRINITY_DN12170_c0_g1_i2.p3 TRINITY_DN12170_c0_g1~~TRINITY_DN12170_c0_g1_i2.p3  ORF type:complete len:101 (+),score=15.04 TRINITY_DN12170_c0_g1_i2:463-765(+)